MEQVDERTGAYPQLTGGDVTVMQRGVATRHMTTSLIRRGCRLLLPKNTARTDTLEAVAGVASDDDRICPKFATGDGVVRDASRSSVNGGA